MALRIADAEGYEVGAAITTANLGSGSPIDGIVLNAGSAVATGTLPIKGLKSYDITFEPVNATYLYWLPTPSHSLTFRMYIRLKGYPTNPTQWVRLSTASGGTPLVTLAMRNTGALIIQNSSTGTSWAGTDANGLQLGVNYRVEFTVTQGTNLTDTCKLQVFEEDSLVPKTGNDVTLTNQAFGTVNIARLSIGKYSNGGAWNGMIIDDLLFADNHSEFFGPSVAATILPSASFDKTHVIEVDATSSTGTTNLSQANGPAVTISTISANKYRVVLPETRNENINLTLTATVDGQTDTEVVTINANGTGIAGGGGPKIFLDGEYI